MGIPDNKEEGDLTVLGVISNTSLPVDEPAKMRPSWLLPAVIVAFTFAVYALTACRAYTHIDAQAATVESWRIAAAGDPWLDDVMTPNLVQNKFIAEAPNGHLVGMRMPGPVIVGIPFYFIFNHDAERGAFTLGPGSLASSACAADAVLMIFLALRRLSSEVSACVGALVFAFATPTWSVSANMLWTHSVTQLGLAGAAYMLARNRWGMAGAFLAFGMLGRPHLALVAAVVGLGMGWSCRSWKPVIQVAVPTGAALAVLGLWNRWMFGVWSIATGYGGKADAAASGFHGSAEWDGAHAQLVNYLGFLVSPDRGFFVWTPAALVCLPAVVRHWPSSPDWTRWLALGGLTYTFFQLRVNYFPGGDGFYGYRHGLELLTCLVPLYVVSLRNVGAVARKAWVPTLGLQLGAIALGAITESFLVSIDDVWTDNSLWKALRHFPLLVGAWLAAGIVLSLLVATRVKGLSRVRQLTATSPDPSLDGSRL